MRPILLTTLLLAACNFDTSTVSPAGDADPNAPDADPNAPDADPNAPDALPQPDADPAAFCGWGYQPAYFDPCTDPPPQPTARDLLMPNEDGQTYVYDTGDGSLKNPVGNTISQNDPVIGGKRFLWTSGFNLGSNATLRVEGSMPLVIVSNANITIAGTINAGSYYGDEDFEIGPGSEPGQTCIVTTPSVRGEWCKHGGGGGGGGGLGAMGGTGGNGAETHNDCDTPDEFGDGPSQATGGVGGGMSVPNELLGGCAGKIGGMGDGDSEAPGEGGPGGGAIHFTALNSIDISGTIHAGGAGGRMSDGNRAGAGGGGSGGMIGIEGRSINASASSTVSANGGGGGGGANSSEAATDGQDAPLSGAQALGGTGESGQGTDGGKGGFAGNLSGESQTGVANRGGGGGGGAAGYILFYQDIQAAFDGVVSPAPIEGQVAVP